MRENGKITGQTADGYFQLGARKTMNCPGPVLWAFIREHKELWSQPDGSPGLETTLVENSHLRMQWRNTGWARHSILQIRIMANGNGKSVLAIHQEKLPDLMARQQLTAHWQSVLQKVSGQFE